MPGRPHISSGNDWPSWGATERSCFVQFVWGGGGGVSDICLSAPDPLCVSTRSGGPLLMAAWEVPPSLSPTFPQRASLPAHSAYLSAFPLAPPRGLFSHSPSLDLLPFLTRAWSGEDWLFFFWITGLSGSPCNALPPLPSRESPFPILHSPALAYLSSLVSHFFLPCPALWLLKFIVPRTHHMSVTLPMLWYPFPSPFLTNSYPFIITQSRHQSFSILPCLPHTELPFLWAPSPSFLRHFLPCFPPPQADRWLHGGRPSACCLVNDQKTLVKWLIGWKRTS